MFKPVVFEFSLMHVLLLSEFDLKHFILKCSAAPWWLAESDTIIDPA